MGLSQASSFALFSTLMFGAVACEPEPVERRAHAGAGLVYSGDAGFVAPARLEPGLTTERAPESEAPESEALELTLTTGEQASTRLLSRDLECEVFVAGGGPEVDPITLTEFTIPVADFIDEPVFFFNQPIPELGLEILFQSLEVEPGPFQPTGIVLGVIDVDNMLLVSSGIGQFSRIWMSPDFPAIQTGYTPQGGLEVEGESFNQLQASCTVSSPWP